jgi:hypothetical protein
MTNRCRVRFSYTKQGAKEKESEMRFTLRLTVLQLAILYVALRQIFISQPNYEHAGFCRDSHPEA